jgi:hypothetical protein
MFLVGVFVSISTQAFTPESLWQAWPETRFVSTPAPCLSHDQLLQDLQKLAERYPDAIQLDEIGRSFMGRPIQLIKLGAGDKKILLWSQMHGDEPSATPALLDIADFLLAHADNEEVRQILENYTLLMIPMLNPDGAEVYDRFNAQGIDINRDALHLATPEGRLLKRIRDEHQPMLGFNLHDQGRRTAVGDTGLLATNAVLAVSGDAANTLTPGRLLAKRANAAIVEALAPFMPGGMARYDEDWSPRAFGDNITAWGTPVVLIESGGLPPGHEFVDLTRLNFVAILTVLKGLAEDNLASYDPEIYEALQRNQSRSWSNIAIRGGYILQPGSTQSFRADLAFDRFRSDRQYAGCSNESRIPSRIYLLGDASFHGAGVSVDATGNLLLPAFDAGVNGWSARNWIDEQNLLRLARLGVGVIYWAVDKTDMDEARTFAKQHAVQGKPRIVVISDSTKLPHIVLSRPPAPVASSSLSEVLAALGVESPSSHAAIAQLWIRQPGDKPESARLRKNQPASFLLVSSTSDGQIDFSTSRVKSVWLDGQKVSLKPASRE